jgi:hypothetical protein
MTEITLTEIALVALSKEIPRIASSIRSENREAISEGSIDLILESKRGEPPQSLAWSIIRLMSYRTQATAAGIEKLLEASMITEPELTIGLLEKHGENEAACVLRGIISTD